MEGMMNKQLGDKVWLRREAKNDGWKKRNEGRNHLRLAFWSVLKKEEKKQG